jgi:hypothetical protein
MNSAERVEERHALAGRVSLGGEETVDKRESALLDCWWVINPANGREHPPVKT